MTTHLSSYLKKTCLFYLKKTCLFFFLNTHLLRWTLPNWIFTCFICVHMHIIIIVHLSSFFERQLLFVSLLLTVVKYVNGHFWL